MKSVRLFTFAVLIVSGLTLGVAGNQPVAHAAVPPPFCGGCPPPCPPLCP